MLDAAWAGLVALGTPTAIFFTVVGIVYGIVIGLLPGLGGIVAMALLLPFTWGMDFAAAMSLLIGAHIATIWGSSATSILFRVPGAAKSVALIFDGYPMTQRGEASRALGASAMAAVLGGVYGAIFLAISIPITRPVMMALGPAEYLMLALWGLTIIATFSEGSLLKGMTAACLGVLTAFIGMDVVTATPRFTFDSVTLMDGISFPVAMIGLFAVSEMMKLMIKGGTLIERTVTEENSSVWQGVRDACSHWGLVIRSSLLGLWIGVLPGIGQSVGSIATYAQALRTSKHPETFGKGNVEGVIAPDASLGANEGGGLLPTLALGIPGGEGMAILLIAFIGLGVVPGPQMLTHNLDLVYTLVWVVAIASIVTGIFAILLTPILARVPTLNPNVIVPLVLAVCVVGAYSDRQEVSDVIVAGVFGVLGYIMDKYRYSRANFVIGMVLALLIERNLHISVSLYGDWFIFQRPVALGMLFLIIFTTAWPFYKNWKRDKELKKVAQAEHGSAS
ncbi:tripartite tricarboxylate transporter permease [Amorphus coralli]|uniref:tripartite tricarboxylate transporter permease n=1 Tax=Amorphus coralli TaxID=340680 RepID=UPI00036C68A1|nr:tripartite tricarboxylate transporter permease [Amorphus coralli]